MKLNKNYTILHLHTMLSNAVTNIDSITTYEQYIDKAKELNMSAITFSEHGSVMGWVKKKLATEKAGLKYIHAEEFYLTETLEKKIRDNYHCLLIAKNYDGVLELNKLSSKSFDRQNNSFYYVPRITIEDVMNTSDNIIVSTACLASVLNKAPEHLKEKFIQWLSLHSDRCYLEIQPHLSDEQIKYNQYLYNLSLQYNIPLLMCTDTHALDKRHVKGRSILQKAKNIHFDGEDEFYLEMLSYDELVSLCDKQSAIPKEVYLQAIENTNKVSDSVESFDLDYTYKYPHLWGEDSEIILRNKIKQGLINRGIINYPNCQEYLDRIEYEMKAYVHNGAIDFMLLMEDIISWCKTQSIQVGYGRGCFTKDALIYTKKSMKTIDKIQIGDEVLSDDGLWHPVLNTMNYNIYEDLIEFEYQKQGSSYKKYKNICTTDHKILVHRDGKNSYIKANEMKVGDLLCSPKIKNNQDIKDKMIIDLQKYNTFGFEYDDKYIYEEIFVNKQFKYSTQWCVNNIGGNRTFWKRIIKRDSNSEIAKNRIALLLTKSGFKTLNDYRKYIHKNHIQRRAIPRYITMDYLWNCFIGLMYGDGWTQKDTSLGLAVNRTTKDVFNRYVFLAIAKRMGLNVYKNSSKNKNLDQLFFNSKILNNFFKVEFFKSEQGLNKQFNPILFSQPKNVLKGLYIGLIKSDGSINIKDKKSCFDSTSLSLVAAIKTIDNIVNTVEPLSLDVRLAHKDKRGFENKESYKVHRSLLRERRKIKEDENFWYLPITKIINHKKKQTTVYDMTVKDAHSYVINNVVVHNSCNGSIVAYLLGITEMDSIKHHLNFDRFMSIERVSLSDIDTDFAPSQINKVKEYVFNKHGLYCADIITFNTIALKGAIRDVGRALEIPLSEVANICNVIETQEVSMRNKYPTLFEYVDIVQGCIVSIGSHPSGIIVSPYSIDDKLGLCTTNTDTIPISQVNMKEIDLQNYVKLDLLKLDTVELINQTCKLANIERLTPDNVDVNDINVWNSIKEDTTGIFQWESDTAQAYLKRLLSDKTISKLERVQPNIDYITLLSMGNGAIRPAGESYREELANGDIRTYNNLAINDFMSTTFGFLIFQEQIIGFLNKYCGFSMGAADVVRRNFSKKLGTEGDIEKIKAGFIKTMKEKYNMPQKEAEENIVSFLKVIEDASNYLFSLNHSQPYSYEGYICGYLRYYYPLEFLTVALNINKDKEEKTAALIRYAKVHKISIKFPKFRYSSGEYFYDKKTISIYKGIGAIKKFNTEIGKILYNLRDNKYKNFIELLYALKETPLQKDQLDILIKIGYFEEFGQINALLYCVEIFNNFYKSKSLNIDKVKEKGYDIDIIKSCSNKATEKTLSQIDNKKLIMKLVKNGHWEKISSLDKIKYQLQYLGDTEYIDKTIDNNIYVVSKIEINSYGTPYITLYSPCYGAYRQVKANKMFYRTHNVEIGEILKCVFQEKYNMKKNEDGEFVRTGGTYVELKCYQKC